MIKFLQIQHETPLWSLQVEPQQTHITGDRETKYRVTIFYNTEAIV